MQDLVNGVALFDQINVNTIGNMDRKGTLNDMDVDDGIFILNR